ncbi:cytochrome b-c1 complex subunit 8-like [Styela clava]
MKLTDGKMGKGFGTLGVKMTSQIQYQLSPFEQPPLKGYFQNGLVNVARRTREKFLYFTIPMVIGYMVYQYGETTNANLKRKNLKDYENDV